MKEVELVKKDDGIFIMTIDEFVNYFNQFSVCYHRLNYQYNYTSEIV